MDDQHFLQAHIEDLMDKTYQRDILTATEFLTEAEQALVTDHMRKTGLTGKVPCLFYGGYDEAVRRVLVFLPSYIDEETFAQGEADPANATVLVPLIIKPLQKKFSDKLTHRDYLGSLMNLGIERGMLGDILVDEEKQEATVFVLKKMADTICHDLVRIKHTSVYAEAAKANADTFSQQFEEMSCSAASERLDAILAEAYRQSRSKAQTLIRSENVSVNGRLTDRVELVLKAGDRVSVRGFGKFLYDGVEGQSRKGRLFVKIRHYR